MRKVMLLILLLSVSGCSSETGADEDCDIKGNLTTYNGEKIYHVPGGQFYEVTKAEEWFCTESEAREAGFRKSER
jgi:hypothetical protein